MLAAWLVAMAPAVRSDRTTVVKDTSEYSLDPVIMPEGGGYTYSRSITIDHTKVPNTTQTNFPLLVSGTYSYLATTVNGGRVQNANGYDVIFTSDSGCATKLNHEVETYNATNGAVNYWVKIPALSHTTDTTIYLCYGNANITTDQSNKSAVWDANYQGVWHLPNGTSLTATDSTNHSLNGMITSTAAATGQVGGGGSFGVSSKIDMGNASALEGMTSLTASVWIKPNSLAGANRILTKWRGSFLVGTKLGAGTVLRLSVEKPGTGVSIFDSPVSTLSTGSWQHCVLTWNQPNTATMHVNGVAKSVTIAQDLNVTSTGSSSSTLQIGYSTDATGNYFDGAIDEVRISNVARTADWSKTEYNNQSSPASFYTISGASGNLPPTANAGGPYSGVSQTSIQLNGGGSSDADGTIASYAWTFGDGTTATGISPTHAYSLSGTYTVTLTVTDNSGATASATTTVTATNRAPTANAGGPYSSLSQTSIQFNGGGSSDADGTITGYAWTFGDGTTGTGVSPTHAYSLSGTYTVTLTVTDNSGATASATASVIATNRAPVANAGGPYSGLSQTSIQFNGSGSSDPDGAIGSYAWNFGDGTTGTGTSPTHAYTVPGTYTVALTVTDNSGATASATATVTVTGTNDARLDPMNRTGGAGEDPLSRNFNWSIPLAALPGRGGLDLGLSLAYNSLATWTRLGSVISFDDDHGFPGPGFRLGFPIIQPAHYNAQAGKYAYLMITPSGSRVELRQVGTSNLYQAVDSSYLLLDASTMTLRTTDGTQLYYSLLGADYQCTQIKDRNGNYLAVNYDTSGRIDTVVDTLARTIKFNYLGNDLGSITQTWTVNGQQQPTHTWATFTYANQTVQTNFTGLSVIGPQNGSTVKVLTRVALADNSRFDFDYTSWGQVWKIRNYGTDGRLLNYRSYNLPLDQGTAQDDCPRFTERRVWAEHWNRNQSGVEQEVITTYALPAATSWTMPDGSQQTGIRAQVTLPDLTYHKIYFAGTAGTSNGWQRGLPSLVETYDSANVRQRQSVTTWTQDDPTVPYLLNPRATEFNVYDPAGNRARTRVVYATFNLSDGTTVRLPQDTYQYQADATTVLRRSRTDYNMSATYADRRIFGLAAARYLCDGAQGEVPCTDASGASLVSKITLQYDEAGSIQGSDAPVQHDHTDFGASFVAGRANLSSARRYDVINSGQFTASSVQYDTAGSVVRATDAANHQTQISYTDAFAANGTSLDTGLPNTLAYPTTITDADGYTAKTRYNYQFGALSWKQTPQPNTVSNLPGPEQKVAYDSIGRIERVTNLVNNAYSRFIYGPNYVETFTTVNTVADEAHSLQVFDGHGRVIAKANTHPGSIGGFSGQLVIYDHMGRVIKTSNPTETNVTINGVVVDPYDWVAAGDDAAAGWVYRQQSYDWKGRPTVTTNQDGTSTTASYGGCGCAGGEVITLTDEVGRKQKIYHDVLGRAWKNETLNWDTTVYSTSVNVFNIRDQITNTRQYAGAPPAEASSTNAAASCPSGSCQETLLTFDGYGRVQSKHAPEQQAGTATTWSYNPDDTIYSVTDARGASATYSYNNRHLVTGISYSAPTGITPTANATFSYDAVGNRISMTDGLGSQSYSYNQLSQMVSESRTFTGVGTFTLGYDYGVSGELKSITDSTNMTIDYGFDSSGRLSSVTGSDNLFLGISTYASNFQYRAWDGLKAMSDGSNHVSSLAYNSNLQPTQFDISGIVHQNYDYLNDGRLSFVHNTTDAKFDRSYSYDHAGRLTEAKTGGQARGDPGPSPYYETFGFDAFGNLTARQSNNWTQDTLFDNASFTNHRRHGWSYDVDGRNTSIGTRTYSFDADGQVASMTGQMWIVNHYVNITQTIGYDGDGEKIKEGLTGAPTYYLKSTVLNGAIIEEIDNSGQKKVGYVYTADGEVLAKQVPLGSSSYVVWKNSTPAGTGQYDWNVGAGYGSGTLQRVELDPMGAAVGIDAPLTSDLGGEEGDIGSNYFVPMADSRSSNFFDLRGGCTGTGTVPASCKSPMSPNDYLQAQTRKMLGDRWYDLPGNDNVRERTEQLYVRDVSRIFAEATAANAAKTKPKPPTLQPQKPRAPLTPQDRKRAEERRRREAKEGTDEGPKYPPVTRSEINIVFGGRQFEFVQEDIVTAIVDIANKQACSNAFKKYKLTIPYDVVKSSKLRVAGRAALYESNAAQLLGWTDQQIADAKRTFAQEDGWWSTGLFPSYTADKSYQGIPTVVFNPLQIRQGRFGSLKDVVTHSFIHLGGRPGDPNTGPHDLASFEGYGEILKACR